jgi:hypothetical protein
MLEAAVEDLMFLILQAADLAAVALVAIDQMVLTKLVTMVKVAAEAVALEDHL